MKNHLINIKKGNDVKGDLCQTLNKVRILNVCQLVIDRIRDLTKQ